MPRRGFKFEIELNRIVDILNRNGLHAHKNHAERTIDGRFVRGEPFDYEVLNHGQLFCFDAKECAAKRWNLGNAKLNQIGALLACQRNGAEAFFLVHFTNEGVIKKFPVEQVWEARRDGRASLRMDEGSDFNWQEIFLTKSSKS